MKAAIVLVIAAVLVASHNAAVVKAPTTARANLNVGYIAYGDRLLYRQYLYQPALFNTIQYQDMVFRGNATTRITAVQATEVGYTQYATPWVIAGGLGWSNVTLRVQSARGYGYYYMVEIWGR